MHGDGEDESESNFKVIDESESDSQVIHNLFILSIYQLRNCDQLVEDAMVISGGTSTAFPHS